MFLEDLPRQIHAYMVQRTYCTGIQYRDITTQVYSTDTQYSTENLLHRYMVQIHSRREPTALV